MVSLKAHIEIELTVITVYCCGMAAGPLSLAFS